MSQGRKTGTVRLSAGFFFVLRKK